MKNFFEENELKVQVYVFEMKSNRVCYMISFYEIMTV